MTIVMIMILPVIVSFLEIKLTGHRFCDRVDKTFSKFQILPFCRFKICGSAPLWRSSILFKAFRVFVSSAFAMDLNSFEERGG